MKKMLTLGLSLATIFSLAACGGSNSNSGSQDTTPADTQAESQAPESEAPHLQRALALK